MVHAEPHCTDSYTNCCTRDCTADCTAERITLVRTHRGSGTSTIAAVLGLIGRTKVRTGLVAPDLILRPLTAPPRASLAPLDGSALTEAGVRHEATVAEAFAERAGLGGG